MAKVEDIIADMPRNSKGIRFQDLCKVCDSMFGELGKKAVVIESIKRHGKATRESISRTIKEWQKRIR